MNKKEINKQRYYIYFYLDPRNLITTKYKNYELNGEVFYVGKGKDCRAVKVKAHNIEVQNKIKEIKSSGLQPIIVKTNKNYTEKTAYKIEEDIIKFIGRKDQKRGTLLNKSSGITLKCKKNIKIKNEKWCIICNKKCKQIVGQILYCPLFIKNN